MFPAIYLLLHLFVSVGVGWLIVDRIDSRRQLYPSERLLFSTLTGYAAIYFSVFAVGIFRLDVFAMSILAAVLAVASIFGLRQVPWRMAKQLVTVAFKNTAENRWRLFLWILLSLLGLSSLLQGMAPPNDYDSLMYHISFPQYDVEIGRISIPWDRALGTAFFPSLMSNQSRIALVLSNSGAAQMLHGFLGIVASYGIVLLMLRLGYLLVTSILAAVLFLSIRVVVWEMGTVEVDVPLAAFSVSAVLAYVIYRKSDGAGLAIIFGLTLGFCILTKYQGFALALCFVPVILYDLISKNKSFWMSAVGPAIALVVYLPHAIRLIFMTSNPIFPIFNFIFNPNDPNFFAGISDAYGKGRGILDVLSTPWSFFIEPMRYYDGMIFGFPILLAFAPLMFTRIRHIMCWLIPISVAAPYYLIWFFSMGQQVRFLLPIFPILAAIAAVGAVEMWRLCSVAKHLRYSFIMLGATCFVGQLQFVGIYSAIRLPVALGMMNPLEYHLNTPTLQGANFKTCTFITNTLKPGAKYYSLVFPLSFYCPQKPVTVNYFEHEARWWLKSKKPATLSLEELISNLEKEAYQFIYLPTGSENRRNLSGASVIIDVGEDSFRFARHLLPAVQGLKPLSTGKFTAVYDGPAVLDALRKQLEISKNSMTDFRRKK